MYSSNNEYCYFHHKFLNIALENLNWRFERVHDVYLILYIINDKYSSGASVVGSGDTTKPFLASYIPLHGNVYYIDKQFMQYH